MDVNIDLKLTLELHRKWRYGQEGGTRANLTGADLTDADLTDADLTGADLTGANLTGADLTGASYNLVRVLRMALGLRI